jgi:hypothetical protein
MTAFPQHQVQHWVPHVRDSFIVANVGLVRSTTAPAHLHLAATSKVEVDPLMPAFPQPRVAHPLQSHRKPGSPPALLVGWKGWVIEQSETASPLHAATSKVEVDF